MWKPGRHEVQVGALVGAPDLQGCTYGTEIALSIKLSLIQIKISELAGEFEPFSTKPTNVQCLC